MTTIRRKKHRPEEVVAKLRDADAMLNTAKDLAAVLQALEISESTLDRWRAQYGEMTCRVYRKSNPVRRSCILHFAQGDAPARMNL